MNRKYLQRGYCGIKRDAITVLTSFLLGRYIIEQEQQGSERAKYGAKVLDSLSSYLTEEYGRGFQEAMLLECVNFTWLTKTERMKLSNRELDN